MKKCLLFQAALFCIFVIGCTQKAQIGTIGLIFPASGGVAHYGIQSRDGIILAAEEINAAGGLLGKKIKLVIEDDEGDSAKTVNIFTKLTTRNKISIILGSSTSGPTMAISELAQKQKVLVFSPSATNIDVTKAGDYVFRTCFIDPFQGIVGANFASETLGSRRAAILYDSGADYNTGLAEAFGRQFTANGGELVAKEAYQTDEQDFNAQITRIKAANPDVVYLPNYYKDVALQAKQFRAQGVNIPLLGGDGWDGLIDMAGDEVTNGYWSSGFASDTTDPKGQKFVRDFEARFNNPAQQFAALGYDTMMILADAIKAAGTFEAEAVKETMKKINGVYVTGSIRFDENRNPIKGAAILEIVNKDGKLANSYKTTVNPR